MAAVNTKSTSQSDVFMTHDWGVDEKGRENHPRVRIINKRLKDLGYRTWFDEDYIHSEIQDAMAEGIDNTRLVLVFLTTRYMQKINGTKLSDNCRQEFLYAFSLDKNILCVTMDDTMSRASNWKGVLKLTLGNSLFVRLNGDFDDNEYLEERMKELQKQLSLKGVEPIVPKKYCPQCKIETDGKKFCDECGTKLQDIRDPKKYCPQCKGHTDGKKFCDECGTKLQIVQVGEVGEVTDVISKKDAIPESVEIPKKDAIPESVKSLKKDAIPESVESLKKDAIPESVEITQKDAIPESVESSKKDAIPESVEILKKDAIPESVESSKKDALPVSVEKEYESRGIKYIDELLVEENIATLTLLVNAKKDCIGLRNTAGGYTPLIRAAGFGNVKAIKLFINKGACVDERSDQGFTPALYAADQGQQEALEYLLTHGASPDDVTNAGQTILHRSAFNGHVEVTRYIVKQHPKLLHRKNNSGNTPMHSAAEGGREEIINVLVTYGDVVDARCNVGLTPLLFGAQFGQLGAIKCLMKHGASPNDVTNGGATGLYLAVQFNHIDVIECLVQDHVEQVERADNGGWTPLHHAASNGSVQALNLLLKAGANVNAKLKSNHTPLDLAKLQKKSECVTILTKWSR